MTPPVVVPSRGCSTKRTLTRVRPGALSPGGEGVGIKHGCYERYLNKLKGQLREGPLCKQKLHDLKKICV